MFHGNLFSEWGKCYIYLQHLICPEVFKMNDVHKAQTTGLREGYKHIGQGNMGSWGHTCWGTQLIHPSHYYNIKWWKQTENRWPLSSLCAFSLLTSWILMSVVYASQQECTCLDVMYPICRSSVSASFSCFLKCIVEKHWGWIECNRSSHPTINSPWAAPRPALLSKIQHLNLFSRFASTIHFVNDLESQRQNLGQALWSFPIILFVQRWFQFEKFLSENNTMKNE